MKGLDVAEFKRWWQQRPAREKLLLGACSLGVVLALGDSLAITPVEKRLRQARGAEEQLQARWDQLQQRRKGQNAQDRELSELEKTLRQRLQAAQAQASALDPQLGNTAQLPDVLRDVIATMGSTQLLELSFADDAAAASTRAAPGASGMAAAARAVASALAPGATPQPAASAAGAGAGAAPAAAATAAAPRRIYLLPVTLKVSGSWAELTRLLNEVEGRAPALQWQSLSLDSNGWPAIQLTLRAHVRSLQPRWGAGP
jgi:Tfp pilus assembly protein PilN